MAKKKPSFDRDELVLAGLIAGDTLVTACRRVNIRRHSWFYLGCVDALAGFYSLGGPEDHGYTRGYQVGSLSKQIRLAR